jgi:hypothetical protein
MRVGYLPVGIVWSDDHKAFFTQIGVYAVEKPYYLNSVGLRTWTVPFPLYLCSRDPQDLEKGLRAAGNSEETIRVILCGLTHREPGPWVEHLERLRQMPPTEPSSPCLPCKNKQEESTL